MITLHLPGIPKDQSKKVETIITAALEAVNPEQAVGRGMISLEKEFPDLFSRNNCVRLVAVGKASIAMTAGIAQLDHFPISAGLVVTKSKFPEKSAFLPPQIQVITGGHPVPNENSFKAGEAIRNLLEEKAADELIVALISGGASALVISPSEGIDLEDYRTLTKLLLACGAEINEINCLRKHIDKFKGGGLLRWASPAPVISLILSDVVNNPLDVIASGPTIPDPTTFQDAWKIIEKYKLTDKLPGSIRSLFNRGINGDEEDTLKRDDHAAPESIIRLIGSNEIAAKAAKATAETLGFSAKILTTTLVGEARAAGQWMANKIKEEMVNGFPRPFCLIAGGETVVTIKGNGLGGRNLETALASIRGLDGVSDIALVTLATDGEDGPTDAAGAVATGDTLRDAVKNGIDPDQYLADNDSYHFWERMNRLIKIGSTGTNVNDLAFLFAF
jgi:hydroxypyruvate reductase